MKAIDILKKSARDFPENPVIIDKFGTLTYAELWADVSSKILDLKNLGIKQGMHVGLCLRDSRDFIIYLFAASGCSATVVPLGVNLKNQEFHELIKDLSIEKLIHYDEFNLEECGGSDSEEISRGIFISNFKDVSLDYKNRFEDAAFIRPTSGTTGRAKGVVFSHKTILERVDNALSGLDINSKDRILWVLPMAYHFIVSIILYIRAGAAVIIPENKLAADLIRSACAYGATILYAGPMDLVTLAEAPGKEKLPHLKWCICTVGGVSQALSRKFELRHSNILRQVYGMIEVGLAIGNISIPPAPAESVGIVMKGFEVRVVNDLGNEVEQGEIGELYVKGPGLFDGYYNPYITREEASKNGWFRTGDLVSFDGEGRYYVAGREKSMILINGKKVFSEEIENILNDHPSIRVSRVYADKSNLKGISAEIELVKEGAFSGHDLTVFCEGKLEEYKIPGSFKVIENIPLTATGKVLRHEV